MSSRHRTLFATTVTPILLLTDLVALLLAIVVVRDSVTWGAAVGSAVGMAVVSRGLHLYQSRLQLSVLDDLPALLLTSLVAALLMLGLAGPTLASTDSALAMAATFAVAMGGLILLARAVVYALVRGLRRRGVLSHPVIVVGAGVIGCRLTESLLLNRDLGLEPIGLIDDGPVDPRQLPAPYLGRMAGLPQAMHDLDVHDVIFAFGRESDARTLALLRHVQQMDAQVFVVPRFFEMMGHHRPSRVEAIRDVAVVRLHRLRTRPGSLLPKRAFDVVVSAVALVLLAPLLAAIAVAVRRETGPGVIFKQERVGRAGRPFKLMKFRSMQATSRESATQWNIDLDLRIGPVGRFLRRTGLDELPQLWNILRGDMSLVGPRPERPHFVEQFSQENRNYTARHRVQSGLTGWAQVNHLRGDTSIADRVRADNYYIENWSLWGDLKIVVRTLGTFRRRVEAPTFTVLTSTDSTQETTKVG